MNVLAALPKAHLHLHLDGAIRAQTLREFSARAGTLPPVLPVGKRYASFGVFMETIAACHDALSSPDDLRRIIGEVVDDAAADGAIWVEVSVWPGLFGGRLGPDQEALLLVLEAGAAAAADFGVGFGLMVAANRHAGPEAAIAVARLAVDLASEGVVSFGLDGDEASYPPAPFAKAFDIAKHGGLLSTPHAGELLGPGSVAVALELLHADRILHGVRAVEDTRLIAQLQESGVCLDVCPTSNFKLGVYEPDTHPLPQLLESGVRCSINADDPLLFGTSLLHEYELCREEFSLTDRQLARIAATSIEASGAPDHLKAATTTGIARWVDDE